MRQRKPSFEELVLRNKQELINDKQAMKKLEEQLENRQTKYSLYENKQGVN
ncbi:FbpB family small basic protein [Aquibacillus rhizosphaerae]|uniref:FbpB family small basic protein n=1 Tax=Aquibacillus rhizosphaerae TaxID=3051431 RepID=A0ABT7LAE9_9BACI|nr:FbpB family small basic protein [Aquibacillus sp. LR5S19]MDL4842165.1 FbpB family small basic protein [Aquibacillus sp. LR5S19]